MCAGVGIARRQVPAAPDSHQGPVVHGDDRPHAVEGAVQRLHVSVDTLRIDAHRLGGLQQPIGEIEVVGRFHRRRRQLDPTGDLLAQAWPAAPAATRSLVAQATTSLSAAPAATPSTAGMAARTTAATTSSATSRPATAATSSTASPTAPTGLTSRRSTRSRAAGTTPLASSPGRPRPRWRTAFPGTALPPPPSSTPTPLPTSRSRSTAPACSTPRTSCCDGSQSDRSKPSLARAGACLDRGGLRRSLSRTGRRLGKVLELRR